MGKFDIKRVLAIAIAFIMGVISGLLPVVIKNNCGTVDLGHGYDVDIKEYKDYLKVAEETVKESLLELKAVSGALKKEGVTVSKDEINKAVEDKNSTLDYKKGSSEYINLVMSEEVELLTEKGIEHFKKKVKVTEEEIQQYIKEHGNVKSVGGTYKIVSTADSKDIKAKGVSFNNIDSSYTVLETGTEERIDLASIGNYKSGDIVYEPISEENVAIILVNEVLDTEKIIRADAEESITLEKAQEEFSKFVSEVLNSVGLLENASDNIIE